MSLLSLVLAHHRGVILTHPPRRPSYLVGTADEPLRGVLPNPIPKSSQQCGAAQYPLAPESLRSRHINALQSQPVFFDDRVDAAITGFSDDLGRVRIRSPISHSHQQLDYQVFKEGGARLEQPVQKLDSHCGATNSTVWLADIPLVLRAGGNLCGPLSAG